MTPEEKKLLAEAEKAEIESLEIKQRLGWKNTGLSLSLTKGSGGRLTRAEHIVGITDNGFHAGS